MVKIVLIDHVDFAHHAHALHRQRHQAAVGGLFAAGAVGDDGHAQIGGHQLLDGVDVVHFQAYIEVADVFHVTGQAAFKQAAGARVLTPENEALGLKLLQSDGGASRQLVLRRHHHAQVIQVQKLGVAVLEGHRPVHDGKVQLIAAQPAAQLVHGIGDDADVGMRVGAAIAAEHPSDERLAAAGGDADRKVAQLLLDVRQGPARAVADGLQAAGKFDEHLALRGQRQFLLISIKYFYIQFLF